MKKAENSRSDICWALLDFHNTLQEATGTCPAQNNSGTGCVAMLLQTQSKLLQPEAPKSTATLIKIAKEKQAKWKSKNYQYHYLETISVQNFQVKKRVSCKNPTGYSSLLLPNRKWRKANLTISSPMGELEAPSFVLSQPGDNASDWANSTTEVSKFSSFGRMIRVPEK